MEEVWSYCVVIVQSTCDGRSLITCCGVIVVIAESTCDGRSLITCCGVMLMIAQTLLAVRLLLGFYAKCNVTVEFCANYLRYYYSAILFTTSPSFDSMTRWENTTLLHALKTCVQLSVVDLNLWPTVYIAIIVLTPGDVKWFKQSLLVLYKCDSGWR